jgi:hypothetical protein
MQNTKKNKDKLIKLGLCVVGLYGVASMQLHVKQIDTKDGFLLGKYNVSVSMAEANATCGIGGGCAGGGGQCGIGGGCAGQ